MQENQIRKSRLDDKRHPKIKDFSDLSQQNDITEQVVQSPRGSLNDESLNDSNSSQNYETPLSSPITPKSSLKSQSPNSEKLNRRVQFQIPQIPNQRGRTQSLSDEAKERRPVRQRKQPIRYGFNSGEGK